MGYLSSGETTKICVTCRCVKEFRSKHCSYCNHCVRRFDHHCPWINNCVGAGNYKFFISFMIVQIISMLNFLVFSSIFLFKNIKEIAYIFQSILISIYFILTLMTTMFVMMQIISHFNLITNGYTTNEFINMFRYNYFRDKQGNLRNPFGNGCRRNWTIFCFEDCNAKLKDEKVIDIENAPIVVRVAQKKNCDEHKHDKQCSHNHKSGK